MGKLQIWFDGNCPLCLREIALMRRLDWHGVIAFTDVAQPDAVCPIDRQALLARFHASEDGVILSGAAAFAAMWRAIPLLKRPSCVTKSSAGWPGSWPPGFGDRIVPSTRLTTATGSRSAKNASPDKSVHAEMIAETLTEIALITALFAQAG